MLAVGLPCGRTQLSKILAPGGGLEPPTFRTQTWWCSAPELSRMLRPTQHLSSIPCKLSRHDSRRVVLCRPLP